MPNAHSHSTRLRYAAIFGLVFAGLCTVFANAQTGAPAEAAAQTQRIDPGAFYGFWQVPEPAGDACIIIIKRGGRLSCFWTGSGSKKILQGSWIIDGERMIATWETNHIDILTKQGENAIERRVYEAGMPLSGEPLYVARGVRVDSRIPGSLTTRDTPQAASPDAPQSEPAPSAAPATPIVSPHVGFWKVAQPTGFMGMGRAEPHFYLRLDRGGRASIALRSWHAPASNEGEWQVDGDAIRIDWPDGRRDLLRPDASSQSAQISTYDPRRQLTDRPDDTRLAERVSPNEASRFFKAGAFERLTTTDIRGTWIPLDEQFKGQRIEIEGWGNAYRYPSVNGDGADPGKWRLQDDRVVISWIDGSKDVLRIGLRTFIRDSFADGEAITGTPSRSMPVAKVETNPLPR